MKISFILILLFLCGTFLYGQEVPRQNPKKVAPNDTIVPGKGTREDQIKKIKEVKVKKLSDSAGNEPLKSKLVDTTKQNKYGDLLRDDTAYNKRYPFWIPTVEVLGALTLTWTYDRFILNADYARTGFNTWKYNIKT
jgi:hypothetical protein